MSQIFNYSQEMRKNLQFLPRINTFVQHLLFSSCQHQIVAFLKALNLLIPFATIPVLAQTNFDHVKVSGYYRKDGTYVQPYFRTAPNATNRDNFSTKGNINPYTGKPGWIDPDSKYNTFYYSTYTYRPDERQNNYNSQKASAIKSLRNFKDRTYIEDEHGIYSCYITMKNEKTFNIYDMDDELILYLVINHRGDWRIFDKNGVHVKTIFIQTEK